MLVGGLGLLGIALAPPVSGAAETSLTVHMVQHIVLLQVAPLLIVNGSRITERGRRFAWCASRGGVLLAWVAGVAATTVWFATPLFAWMMRSALNHGAAQATLVAAGLLFWSPVFSRCRDYRLPAGAAIAYLFAACVASTVTGASIAFAAPGLYGHHAASALDQQIAGLVMWLPCCVVYVLAVMTTLARWYGGVDDGDERSRVASSEA